MHWRLPTFTALKRSVDMKLKHWKSFPHVFQGKNANIMSERVTKESERSLKNINHGRMKISSYTTHYRIACRMDETIIKMSQQETWLSCSRHLCIHLCALWFSLFHSLPSWKCNQVENPFKMAHLMTKDICSKRKKNISNITRSYDEIDFTQTFFLSCVVCKHLKNKNFPESDQIQQKSNRLLSVDTSPHLWPKK